nr:hypothetical protein [Candidatus Cloacimonadota bacterium]
FVTIYTDFIGRRKVFYYENKLKFAISNLDHMLVPFMSKPINFDEVSLASSIYFDWSLLGKSYLKQLKTTNPDHYVEYNGKRTNLNHVNYNLPLNDMNSDEIINDYIVYLDNFLEERDNVHFDLTAGLDTRTVLALLLNFKDKKIIAETMGKGGMDFETARFLANSFHLDHINSANQFSNADEFITHSTFLSFCNNGDTTSIRAINKIKIGTNPKVLKVIGIYGTIAVGKNIIGDIQFNKYQEAMFKNKKKIGFLSNDVVEMLKKRLYNYLEYLRSNFDDLTQELYYIRERCGNWGSTVFNSTWNLEYITPFEDINAMQKMLSLSKHKRHNTTLQHYILRKQSKLLYFYPINQNPFNNGYSLFIPAKQRLFLRRLWNFAKNKIEKQRMSTMLDISNQRNNLFQDYFGKQVKPSITRSTSISKHFISEQSIEQMIIDFEKQKIGFNLIPQLYSLELWKDLVDKMSELNRQD